MSEKLKNLLEGLSTDTALAARFRSAPTAVLDEADVSADEREALENGDVDKLRSMVAPTAPIAAGVFVVVYVRDK